MDNNIIKDPASSPKTLPVSAWRKPEDEEKRRRRQIILQSSNTVAGAEQEGNEVVDYMIDIGANLAHKRFVHDLQDVLDRSRAANVKKIVITGTSIPSSIRAIQLAKQNPQFLYATVGIHPHDAKHFNETSLVEMKKLIVANIEQVRAIGECGLDFDRNFSTPEAQIAAFRCQLELACELRLPVFLHERSAHEAFVAILEEYRPRLGAAVVHCFTGTESELKKYVQLDLHIGITGWICDERRGQDLQKIVPLIPWNRLMIET